MLGNQGLYNVVCRGVSFLFSQALIQGRAINGVMIFWEIQLDCKYRGSSVYLTSL